MPLYELDTGDEVVASIKSDITECFILASWGPFCIIYEINDFNNELKEILKINTEKAE